MRLSTRYGLTGVGALGLLAAVHHVRGMGRPLQPASDYLLGVLPNFAAAVAITFALLGIWADQRRGADSRLDNRQFLVCAFVSGFGLVSWELLQKTSSRLVFDPHDVGATFAGLIAANLLFQMLGKRSPDDT